jgi:predicted PurR-regulated permease PerM
MHSPLHGTHPTFPFIHHIFFFGLLLGGLFLFGTVINPFLAPLFWATIFAIILYPLQEVIKSLARRVLHTSYTLSTTLASLLTILIFLGFVIVPLGTLATIIADQAVSVYTSISNDDTAMQRVTNTLTSQLDHVGISPEEARAALTTYGKSAATWVSGQALSVGTATLVTAVKLVIMLYLLFFLLRDGTRVMSYVRYLLPLGSAREDTLFHTFTSITRSIFKGTLVVAILQGLIGLVLFLIAGVPHALLAAGVMTLLACIPGIGPALVWLPVGLVLFFTGDVFGGLVILLGGAIVISLVDNILRPLLVGRETSLPDPIIFISILGGIATFGIAGVLIGPISAGLCLSLLQMFSDEYGEELERH